MVARCAVKLVDMDTGERMPLLVDADGMGVFEATAFSLVSGLKERTVKGIAMTAGQQLAEANGYFHC